MAILNVFSFLILAYLLAYLLAYIGHICTIVDLRHCLGLGVEGGNSVSALPPKHRTVYLGCARARTGAIDASTVRLIPRLSPI